MGNPQFQGWKDPCQIFIQHKLRQNRLEFMYADQLEENFCEDDHSMLY